MAANKSLKDMIDDLVTDYLANATYGLSALETLVDDLESRLTAARAGYLDNINNPNLQTLSKYAWKLHDIAALNQDPPVQDTWYTVLDTTEDVMLIEIAGRQINDETDPKDLEWRLTIDGVTLTIVLAGDKTHANNTWLRVYRDLTLEGLTATGAVVLADHPGSVYGQSVKVELRMISAPGTNQKLDGRVKYYTWEAT